MWCLAAPSLSLSAPPLDLYSSFTSDPRVRCSVDVPRVSRAAVWQLRTGCQSNSALIYSGRGAKNKQNGVKLVLGRERRLILDCAAAKKHLSPRPIAETSTDTPSVCVCWVWVFAQTLHVLWLIKPEHEDGDRLQMLRRGDDEGF